MEPEPFSLFYHHNYSFINESENSAASLTDETPSYNSIIRPFFEFIGNLSKTKSKTEKSETKKSETSKECDICMDQTTKLITICCKHSLCEDCRINWFVKNNKKTCPYCRKNVSA
jgi:hypothetical protein